MAGLDGFYCTRLFDCSTICVTRVICHSLTTDLAGAYCLLPKCEGQGSVALARWYYDSYLQACQPFTYRGSKGNQNNFLTRVACESAGCIRTKLKLFNAWIQRESNACLFWLWPFIVWQNPCTQDVKKTETVTCTTNTINSCPVGYWCHVGGNLDSTICCPGGIWNLSLLLSSLPSFPTTFSSS